MTKTINNLWLVALAAVVLLLSATSVFAADVEKNGSFELGTAPGSFITLGVGSTAINDWNVVSGGIDYIGSYWNASTGTRSIDLNSTTPGAISQTIETVPGALYTVSFDLSGNPMCGTTVKVMRVSADAATAVPSDYEYNVASNETTRADMKWVSEEYIFVASANHTTLTFASQVTSNCGPALDGVVVSETLPDPVMCPIGTVLGEVPNETVMVDSGSFTPIQTEGILAAGENYIFKVSETWENGGGGNAKIVDAEYTSANSTDWSLVLDGPLTGDRPNQLDLQVDEKFVDWGAYSTSHEYSYLYTGAGTNATFLVFDGDANTPNTSWYGDNEGTLSVDVYPCIPKVAYITGGGNYKEGKGKDVAEFWTFGGNVWMTGVNEPTGAFQLVDHLSGLRYHFNSITSLVVSDKTATFEASGWMQGSKDPVVATFVVTDNGEPGKEDTIAVTGGATGLDATITGGNFQVFSNY